MTDKQFIFEIVKVLLDDDEFAAGWFAWVDAQKTRRKSRTDHPHRKEAPDAHP